MRSGPFKDRKSEQGIRTHNPSQGTVEPQFPMDSSEWAQGVFRNKPNPLISFAKKHSARRKSAFTDKPAPEIKVK